MKLLIAGTRNLKRITPELLTAIMENNGIQQVTEVVSGHGGNIDLSGEDWAREKKLPLVTYYANWNSYGRAAGPMRNFRMAEHADELLLIWDGKSPGSKNMKSLMLERNKPVHEVIINDDKCYV